MKLDSAVDYSIRTQAEVVATLPQWMVADFDCPVRGAHEWLWVVPPGSFNEYAFCKHCPKKRRRVDPWDDMLQRDPLEVVYALQFSR